MTTFAQPALGAEPTPGMQETPEQRAKPSIMDAAPHGNRIGPLPTQAPANEHAGEPMPGQAPTAEPTLQLIPLPDDAQSGVALTPVYQEDGGASDQHAPVLHDYIPPTDVQHDPVPLPSTPSWAGHTPSHWGWDSPQDIPRFMSLPFPPDPDIVLLQGWFYDSGGLHSGVDYFRWDENKTFTGFPVHAAADGYACGEWVEGAIPEDRAANRDTHMYADAGYCVRGYGNRVFIRHILRGETFYTYYGHLETIADTIPLGNRNNSVYVKRGQVIGYAGNTGTNGSAIHLHFGLLSERLGWIDPYDIRAKHHIYPDTNRTNGLLSGANDFWITNPPTHAFGFGGLSQLSETFADLDADDMPDPTTSELHVGLNDFWTGDSPAYESGEIWAPEGAILTPRHNALVTETVNITGWSSVHQSVIDRVEVWINGRMHQTTSYSDTVIEPGEAYEFDWNWNTAQQMNGIHMIQVNAVATNGVSTLLPAHDQANQTTIMVNIQNPFGYVETPYHQATVSGKQTIEGWAKAEGSTIDAIELWIDGTLRGQAKYGLPRPDVGGNCGFAWEWDTTQEHDGVHMIQVRAIASNGGHAVLLDSFGSSEQTLLVNVRSRGVSSVDKWTIR